MSRRWKHILLGSVLGVLGLGVVVVWLLGYEPPYYRQALEADPGQQSQASQQMVAQALQLTNQVKYDPHWEALFTQEQINGYLAVELPQNHPEMLPPEVKQPRVWITSQGVYVFFRYRTGALNTVIHILVDAYVTEDHQVALHLRQVRAGMVPLPMSEVVELISQQASRLDVSLRWAQKDGRPVALIQIPPLRGNRRVVVDSIQLERGQVLIRGRTLESQSVSELWPQGSNRQ